MVKKLARIFGIVGGALTLLPWLVITVQLAVSLKSNSDSFGFLLWFIPPTFIATMGFIGGFLVHKNHILAGIMMIVSGVCSLCAYSLTYNSLSSWWWFGIPNLLLIAGGVLSLVYQPKTAAPPPGEPDSNTP